MALTYAELMERLKKVDEVSLLEILDISSEDIVAKFVDKIEERMSELMEELEDEESDTAAS